MPGAWRRTFLLHWIILELALAVLGASVGANLFRGRRAILAQEAAYLATQARVLAENLSLFLGASDRALRRISTLPAFGARDGDGPERLNEELRIAVSTLPGVHTLLVTDAQGVVTASNTDSLIGERLAFRDYFQQARTANDPGRLYLSTPIHTLLGVWSMILHRSLRGPDGAFAGLVGATLDEGHFRAVMSLVNYAPDMWISLAHNDGTLYLMDPQREGTQGLSLAQPGSFFTRHLASGGPDNVFSGRVMITGEERMMAMRTVLPPDLPLDRPPVAAAGRDLSAITAAWRADALTQARLFLLAALLASAGLYFFQRRQRASLRQAEEAAQRLNRSETRFRTLFERSSEALLLIDGDHFVDANATALHMLGFADKDQLLGQPPEAISPEFQPDGRRSRDKAEALLEQVRREGSLLFEWTHRRADGEVFLAEVGLSAIELEGRPLLHVAWRDITRRKEEERTLREARDLLEETVARRTEELSRTVAQLRAARDQAESASRMKGAFLAGISHELRTPLNQVLGMLQLLQEDGQGMDRAEGLRAALEGATRLSAMVDQIIALTGLEGAKPASEPLVLSTALAMFRESFAEKARAKGLALALTLDPDAPGTVMTDPALVQRLLQNLGENAVKFTSQGQVSLEVSARADGAGGGMLVLAVSDTGLGMSPETMEAVTRGLTQGEASLSRRFGGLGLGLATVRKGLEVLGGRLEVVSAPGRGSVFTLNIPVGLCALDDLAACLGT